MPIGDVEALWCYPVKSMQGVEFDVATLTERGLIGDRAYAIFDKETGCVASAKHPRKWGRVLPHRGKSKGFLEASVKSGSNPSP